MKKLLVLVPCLAATMFANAQLVFEDNFDSYSAGGGLAAQSGGNWDTWTGNFAGEDAEVSSAYSFSGLNSAYVNGTAVDLVLPLNPIVTSGKMDVSFKMLLPTGSSGAYFNALHEWASNSTNYEWAMEAYFDAFGNFTYTAGGNDGAYDTAMPVNEWFDVKITADIDADLGFIYLNGVQVVSWQWSIDSGSGLPGMNQLAAVDFYGTDAAGGGGEYYIDDVRVENTTGVGITNTAAPSSKPSLFPNPADAVVNLSFLPEWNGAELKVSDLAGRIVHHTRLNTNELTIAFSTAQWSNGMYLVQWIKNNATGTMPFVVQHGGQ